MRSVSEGLLNLWKNKGFKVDTKVSVYDGSSWRDLNAWQNKRWLYSISLEDSIEDNIIEATIKLAPVEGKYTISPFVYPDSPLQVWRKIKIEVCLLPSTTWINIFEGYIDSIEITQEEITIRCRDLGALLIDTFIEAVRVYGTDNGTAVEGEMQKILHDNLGTGVISLYTPISPNWYVKKWEQEQKSVMEALRDLADQIGWFIRYKWDNSTSQWRLTFWPPQRSNTTPVITLTDTNFFEIKRLGIDVAGTRNKVEVSYISDSDMQKYTVQDDTSIAKYGKRYLGINCSKTSNINTNTEAQTLANNILADLKDPKLELEIELPFAPFFEIGDCIQVKKNLLLNSDQTLYIDSISHEITNENATTTLKLSGTAKYGQKKWLQIENRVIPDPLQMRDLIFDGEFSTTSTTYVDIPNSAFRFTWGTGKIVFEITTNGSELKVSVGRIRLVKINDESMDGSLTQIFEQAIGGLPLDYNVIKASGLLEYGSLYKFQCYAYHNYSVWVRSIKIKKYGPRA